MEVRRQRLVRDARKGTALKEKLHGHSVSGKKLTVESDLGFDSATTKDK